MLTGESKRKIDGLRDILVGKLSGPTDQVKQITLGLTYKFMSDIDEQNKDLGGKSFFTGEYEQYAWRKIMDSSLSAYDRSTLYSEGLEKMSFNPGIHQLFRDIFKDARLPFRDPATVNDFLKGLNEFKYEHSEDLGDAFEYLLSIMGSQGKAGQFRTPRHIIDFIVEAVEPQKTDKVLDPACGTAGFLISAYKHILANNTIKDSNRPGSALSATEQKNLTHNFVGYDISPDMVRISKVNMYLHLFPDPQIFEYDTLTSLDNWNDMFDCILTNPPFMTPKGGIRSHNRFGIRANRSEVLFVDYIIEHLTPAGKAGMIVPEGIIFQSNRAYTLLRKTLIETNYLYAVVSLPAGVFNPYSGVKTSILLMDRRLAQNANDILFLKVENDGYDLGAQRRDIDKNDLPFILEIIKKYKVALIENKAFKIDEKNPYALLIPKSKILESEDYNLTADRYRKIKVYVNQKWGMVKLGDIADFIGGFAFNSKDLQNEKAGTDYLPVIKIGNLNKDGHIDFSEVQYYQYIDSLEKFLIRFNDILIAMTGATVGKVASSKYNRLLINQRVGVVRSNKENILQAYLKILLLDNSFYEYCQLIAGGGAQGNISPTQILDYKIPLPPVEVQQQIVAEIEQYQKVIDGCKEVVKNWRPMIKINPEWPIIEIGQLCEILDSQRKPVKEADRNPGPYPYYGASGIVDYVDKYIFDEKLVLIGEDGAKWEQGEQTAFIATASIG